MMAFFLLFHLVYIYWPTRTELATSLPIGQERNDRVQESMLDHFIKLPLATITFVPWILIVYLENIVNRLSRFQPNCIRPN